MRPGTAARTPAATPAGTRCRDTLVSSRRLLIAPASANPHAPVRKANGKGTSIGWMGWPLIEAWLLMRPSLARGTPRLRRRGLANCVSPAKAGHYVRGCRPKCLRVSVACVARRVGPAKAGHYVRDATRSGRRADAFENGVESGRSARRRQVADVEMPDAEVHQGAQCARADINGGCTGGELCCERLDGNR